MKRSLILCGALLLACRGALAGAETNAAAAPRRAILFVIDGLHWQAPERLALPNLQRLCDEGTRVTKTYLVAPAHPRTGAWAALHTCSLPNPVLLAGTLFITPDHPMIQHAFPNGQRTLHITNGRLYESLRRGFSHAEAVPGDDAGAIRTALERSRDGDWSLLCVHLQDTGKAGYRCGKTRRDVPGRGDIWAVGSPYVDAARNADRLLGEFLQALAERGQLASTLVAVTSDHGQASTGGHPALDPEGWVVPLVFAGPGVARGRVLAQAEQTDIVPTLCAFMNVPPPASGPAAGRPIAGLFEGSALPDASAAEPPLTLQLNAGIREFRLLVAQALAAMPSRPQTALWIEEAEGQFYGFDRILDWPRLGSPEAILKANRAATEDLKTILRGEAPRWQGEAPTGAIGAGAY